MISVCMATHNGAKYIKEQLDSIICQLSTDDEIIISDDGSTDDTLEIIEKLNDARIKVYRYSQPVKTRHAHIYATHNFENAIKRASGRYIFICDQDDIWHPNKVEICVSKLKESDMVVHNLHIIDSYGNDMFKNEYEGDFKKQNIFVLGKTYYGCSMAFKSSYVKSLIPFPKYLVLHDYWIGIIIQIFGTIVYVDEPLIDYRLRDDSVSHSNNNSLWFKVSYRIYIMLHLFIRILKLKLYDAI